MDCLGCREQFSVVMEASASPLALQASEHLELCPACNALYESFRQTVHQLRELPVVSPPAGLLQQITAALDLQAAPRRSVSAYWQPLTAGLSMAACCLMVMWAVVLHPTAALPPANMPQLAQVDYSLMTPPAPQGASMSRASAAPTSAAPPAPRMRGVSRPARIVGPVRAPGRSPRVALTPFAGNFGQWGHSVPAVAPAANAGTVPSASGKPANTFAAGDPATVPAQPLNKTPGEVHLTFTPPVERVAGALAVGQLVVVGQAEANVTIRLQPQAGLRVLNAREGVLYQGALRQGQKLELPVRMVALKPGAQRMELLVEADVEGVGTQLSILVPSFAPAPAGEAEKTVSVAFQDTPSLRAIRELAAMAGARVRLEDGLESQLVTSDFRAGVPFAVALQTVCDGCGYQVALRDGVYHVTK